MQKRFSIGISFDHEIIDAIDEVRGMIPRSRFIEKIIKDNLEIQDWLS